MKFLTISSYIASIAALMLGAYIVVVSLKESLPLTDMLILSLPIILMALTQLFHTNRARKFIEGKVYKSTDQLDEYALNDIEHDEYVVHTLYWQKIVTTVNSIALCLFSIYIAYQLNGFLNALIQASHISDALLSLLGLIIFLFAIPTVVFNLRTHRLTRVVKG
ncbi:MAG TPA: hypothetical protein VIK71_10590 [Flavobacteriales bacterium]